jgi:hypothetical protein
MKHKNRVLALKIYGHHYERFGSDWNHCFYCGAQAEGFDHVPPISIVAEQGAEYFRRRGYKLFLIASCEECNNALGNRELLTVAERSEFLTKKYTRMMETRNRWTQDEIDALDGNLKDYVVGKNKRTAEIMHKLRNVEKVCFIVQED